MTGEGAGMTEGGTGMTEGLLGSDPSRDRILPDIFPRTLNSLKGFNPFREKFSFILVKKDSFLFIYPFAITLFIFDFRQTA